MEYFRFLNCIAKGYDVSFIIYVDNMQNLDELWYLHFTAAQSCLNLFAMKSCTDSWYILRHNDGVRWYVVIASRKNDVYRCVETTAVVLPEIDPVYEDDSWTQPRGNQLLGEKRIARFDRFINEENSKPVELDAFYGVTWNIQAKGSRNASRKKY